MNKKHFSWLLCNVLGVVAFNATAYQLICPAFVETTSAMPVLKSIPEGWDVISRASRIRLSGGTLTAGRPEKFSDLKPEQFRLHGKIYEWQLSKEDLTNEGVWFSCSYNIGQVFLAQRIAESVSACRLITSGQVSQFDKVVLDCE